MGIELARVRAICFDVDGTLSDTDDQWVAALDQRLRVFRWLFPRGDTRSFARWTIMCAETPGNLFYHFLDRANLDAAAGRAYSLLSQSGVGRKPPTSWVIPGVCELLEQLHGHYRMAVVSARDRKATLAFLQQHGLQHHFQAVASALTCRHTKPFPDPVLWAAEQMGVPPAGCLVVGDTTVDIRAGKSAGAQTIGVLCGFGREDELRRAGADLILASTAELAQLLLPESPPPPQT